LPEVPQLDVAPGALPGIPRGPLAVVVSRPQGQLQGNERPTITFNKPVVPLGAATADHPTPATLTPAVDGEWRWLGSTTAEFLPRAPFPYATEIVVTVNPALKALDGEGLAAPATFSFSTLPPALVDVEPRRNWPWLDAGKPILLTFNQPVDGLQNARLQQDGSPVAFSVVRTVDVDAELAQREGRPARGRTTFGRPTRYELQVKGKVAPDRLLRLTFDGVRATEGPATVADAALVWRTRGPLRFESARFCAVGGRCPQGPLVLVASGAPDVDSLKGRLHVRPRDGSTPGVEIALNVEDALMVHDAEQWPDVGQYRIVVDGAFQPGRAYDVVIDAGVVDDAGQQAAAFASVAKTTDIEPWLRVPTPVVLLERDGDGALPVETANIDAVNATVWPQDLPSLARFLSADDGSSRTPEGDSVERVLEIANVKNSFVRTPLGLQALLPAGAPQLFVADIWSTATKETAERQRVVGQLTDLAAHAKLGATGSLVWVTSLKTGLPVPGATVAVWDRTGTQKHEGVTDVDGLVRMPGAVDMLGADGDDDGAWFVPWALVSATKGSDTGVTLSTWRGEYGWVMQEWDGDVADVEAVVFSERGIYRPGEKVFVKGVVRTRTRGALALPKADSELALELSDGEGGNKQKVRVPISRFGTFDATFALPATASLGWWSIGVDARLQDRPVYASTSFRVEQYRAPQFKVDVSAPTRPLFSGETLQAIVNARYLFGAPMPGAAVETTTTRETTYFQPPGLDAFTFGVEIDGWSDTEPMPGGDVYARSTGTVGNDGTFSADVGVVEATAGRTWRYTVEANVTDVSRQAVAGTASVVVHPASLYAGVQIAGGFGSVGAATEVKVVVADLDGKRVGGRPVNVVVKRRDWKNTKRRNEWNGMLERQSEPVDVDAGGCPSLQSTADTVACTFLPQKAGLHVVEATVTDDAGRTQRTRTFFYVAGGGWVSWRSGDDDSIELVADKKAYDPGEKARVIVKSPWPRAEAIVTVEREGVKDARRVTLEGAAQAIDVPITDADVPNVFVGVVLVRGRVDDKVAADSARPGEIDPGRPQVKVGTLNLHVRPTKKRLDVVVDAGAGTKRPGQKLQLKVAVKDSAKKGVPAEVTLWAVDEAVLRLTGYTPPDIAQAFHPERGLSVRLGEPLIHLVRRRTYGTKGEPGGDGGGGPGSGFRSDFKTTAWFLPGVVTDANGNATVEVQLPDDLTTYRVMALAVAADDRFGSGRGDVVVQKPVMALPALPRFARVGDRFEAGVVVHSLEPGELVVTASSVDGSVTLTEEAKKTVRVDGRGVEVRFAFTATKDGRAGLRFTVEKAGGAADQRDAVEMRLPVLLPVVLETTAVSGMTDDRREEALAPPSDARPDVGGLEVSLSSTALAGSREAMQQLVDYPHGCGEQLASKLVPFLALRELQAGFGEAQRQGSDQEVATAKKWLGPQILDDKGNAQPDRIVAATIERLLALQGTDGGFRVWPESACESADVSSWATLALARAKAVGYRVDAGALKRATGFLRDNVLADRMPACSWGRQRVSTDERVFAGFVLSRAGQPRVAPLRQIASDVVQKPESLSLFSRALLIDALIVGKGDAALAQQVLQTVMNAARETARDVHFEEPEAARYASAWASDVRTSAVVLMTLAAASPDHPFVPKLASFLDGARQKDGRYRTTQEAAWALVAQTELVRAKERGPPSFAANVTLAGASLVQQDFRGRSLDVGLHVVPMVDVTARGAGALPFVFEKTGNGTLYYSAVLRRAPQEIPTTPLERGFVVQRFFEPIDDATRQGNRAWAGDLVRVRVRVATRDARHDVAVDVPLPAGLEAVDTSLSTTAGAGRLDDTSRSEGEEGGEYGGEEGDDVDVGSFWSPFLSSEKRDDRVSYYADLLPPGVHTLTFIARATTIGTFALLPAEATEMYAPEVFGRSGGGTFDVVAVPAR
jgi:hypothetical protein